MSTKYCRRKKKREKRQKDKVGPAGFVGGKSENEYRQRYPVSTYVREAHRIIGGIVAIDEREQGKMGENLMLYIGGKRR